MLANEKLNAVQRDIVQQIYQSYVSNRRGVLSQLWVCTRAALQLNNNVPHLYSLPANAQRTSDKQLSGRGRKTCLAAGRFWRQGAEHTHNITQRNTRWHTRTPRRKKVETPTNATTMSSSLAPTLPPPPRGQRARPTRLPCCGGGQRHRRHSLPCARCPRRGYRHCQLGVYPPPCPRYRRWRRAVCLRLCASRRLHTMHPHRHPVR